MLNILIVDDAAQVCERIVEFLRSVPGVGGIEQVATIAAARERIVAANPDLIVLDIGLPDGSGIDLLRELTRSGRREPIVMLTGAPLPPHRAACMTAGATAFLDKAKDCDRLLELVIRMAAAKGVL